MRILHLIDAMEVYGAERIVLDLMEYQNRRGWSTLLGSIARPGQTRPLEEVAKQRGLAVQQFPMRRGLNLAGGRRIATFAKRMNYDVLHSHSYKGNIIIGALPKRMRQLPFMVTLHGWRPPNSLLLRSIQTVEKFAIYRADRVVAVHPTLARDQRLSGLDNDRLHVIRNGIVPTSEHQHAQNAELAADLEKFTAGRFAIGAIGRLSPEKGMDRLIRAVANLRKDGTDCVLTIFGAGVKRNELEHLICELSMSAFVRMVGYIPGAIRYQSAFDCLAIPSYTEACPLVALEGMQAGVPVVASSAGGLPDLLEHGRCGRLFPVGDVAALQDAILAVHREPDSTRERISAGLETAGEYSTQRMENEYAQLYREVCSRHEKDSPC